MCKCVCVRFAFKSSIKRFLAPNSAIIVSTHILFKGFTTPTLTILQICVLCIAMQINVCAFRVREFAHSEQLNWKCFLFVIQITRDVRIRYGMFAKETERICILKKTYGKSNLVKTPRNVYSLSSAFKRMFAFPRA